MIYATIAIPRTPKSWNAFGRSWRKNQFEYRREKLMWRTYFLAARNSAGPGEWTPQGDFDPIPRVTVSITVYTKRDRDPDRLVVQPMLDALHTRKQFGYKKSIARPQDISSEFQGIGLLVDDSSKYLDEVRLRCVKVRGNVFVGTVIRVRDTKDYIDIDADVDEMFKNVPEA